MSTQTAKEKEIESEYWRAIRNLNSKTSNGRKLSTKMFKCIIKEERKNPNYYLAILKLLMILPWCKSAERKDQVIEATAFQLGKFIFPEDRSMIDFLINHGQIYLMKGEFFEQAFALFYVVDADPQLLTSLDSSNPEVSEEAKKLDSWRTVLQKRNLLHYILPNPNREEMDEQVA